MRIQAFTRQLIIQDLISIGSVEGNMRVCEFVRRAYPKANGMPTTDHRFGMETAIDDIRQHMDNNDDWDYEYLFFDYLGLLRVPDADFKYFLEQYVHPTVRRSTWHPEDGERVPFGNDVCAQAINRYLTGDGYEMREVGQLANLPVYQAVAVVPGAEGSVKNIIFASRRKPDIVISDALGNEVRVLDGGDDCLVYDLPIPAGGISWEGLAQWYGERYLSTCGDMVSRLRDTLDSPIEEQFFDAYLEFVAEHGGSVPALIPQVWLYYDPVIQKDRLERIFEHQRMDFLMVVSDRQRIVIELDGMQHYGERKTIPGRAYPEYVASAQRYADMVSAQREMTLAGYEVYRFGGKEFADEERAGKMVRSFLLALFERHGVL